MNWKLKYVGDQNHRMSLDDSRMDIDPSEHHPHGVLGPSPLYARRENEEPARKRLHSEMQSIPPPFNAHKPNPNVQRINYGTNDPMVFSIPSVQDNNPYGLKPNVPPLRQDWKDKGGFDPGVFEPITTTFSSQEDVEMHDVGNRDEAGMGHRDHQIAEEAKQPRAEEVPQSSGAAEAGEGTQDGKSEASSKAGDRPIAKGGYKRIQKQRQKQLNRRRSDQYAPYPHGPTKTEHTFNLNTNTTLRHSEIPAMLLGYLQFFVNAAVVVFALYFAVQFVLTVRRDVQDKMAEASIDILQEISECSQLYLTNRCDPKYRVPAMEAPCRAWDACMSRDPTRVGRTNVLAETFAGVINSFVDPISWKTMSFTLVTLSFLIVLTNSALFNLRHRAAPDVQPPPPTPQHLFPQLQAPWMSGGQHHQGYHNQGYQQAIHQGQYGQEGDQVGHAPLAIENGSGKTKKKGWWG